MDNKKYLIVEIKAKNHSFRFECTNISDAYEAISDASEVFDFELDKDSLMECLVKLKIGTLLSSQNARWLVGIVKE